MKKIIFVFLTLFIVIPSSKAFSKFHITEKVPKGKTNCKLSQKSKIINVLLI